MQISSARSNRLDTIKHQTDARKSPWALGVWLALLLIVIVGELLPGDSAPVKALTFRFSDKVLHMSAYAMLAAWPVYAMRLRTAIVCLGIAECIGILLEYLQTFIPNRSFDLFDIAANSGGLGLGFLLALALRFYLIKGRSKSF